MACSVSVFTKLTATSVNSLTSDELARNMSQSTSSRDACSIASEWGTNGHFPLHRRLARDPLFVFRREKDGDMIWFAKSRRVSGLCRRYWAECSSDPVYSVLWWTGYVWWKFGRTFLRLALLKSPAINTSSVGMFVDISADFIVEIGQSHASVCLWRNINGRHEDRCNSRGR